MNVAEYHQRKNRNRILIMAIHVYIGKFKENIKTIGKYLKQRIPDIIFYFCTGTEHPKM